MAKVIRKKQHFHPLINGVKFEKQGESSISEEISDEKAALFLIHAGYELEDGEEAPAPDLGHGTETVEQRKVRMAAEAAQLAADEKAATEKLAADTAAAEKKAADEKAAKDAADKLAADEKAAQDKAAAEAKKAADAKAAKATKADATKTEPADDGEEF